jgi:PAS domain S-box-containing protein
MANQDAINLDLARWLARRSPEPAVLFNETLTVTEANAAAKRLFGDKATADTVMRRLQVDPQEFRERLMGEAKSATATFGRHDLALVPIREGDGFVLFVHPAANAEAPLEIRQNILAQQRAIADLGVEAIGVSTLEQFVSTCLGVISRILGVPVAQVRRLNAEQELVLFSQRVTGEPIIQEPIPLESDDAECRVFRSGVAQLVQDSGQDEGPAAESLLRRNLRSGIAVAVPGRSPGFGSMLIADQKPRDFTDDDLGFLLVVANLIAIKQDREHNLRTIQQNSERLERLLKNNAVSIVFANRNTFQIFDGNTAFLNMVGLTRADLPIDWRVVMPRETTQQDEQVIEQLFEVGATPVLERTLVGPEGEPRYVLASATVLDREEGTFVAFYVDRTKQREAETALRRLNEELEQRVAHRTQELEKANYELEAFTYAVSHDLKAPLRAIRGFSQILKEDHGEEFSAAANGWFKRLDAAATKMGDRLEGLLRLSRVSRATLTLEQLEISDLARDAFQEATLGQADGRTSLRLEPGLQVYGDLALVRALLDNLISNAVKFSSESEEPVVHIFPRNDWIVVKDNGVGFEPTDSPKLFKPFERLHSSERFAGSGIGLATAHRVVERHGGEIRARSEGNGKGAEIEFRLPKS